MKKCINPWHWSARLNKVEKWLTSFFQVREVSRRWGNLTLLLERCQNWEDLSQTSRSWVSKCPSCWVCVLRWPWNGQSFSSVLDPRSQVSVPVCLLENVYGEAKCQKDALEQNQWRTNRGLGCSSGIECLPALGSSGFNPQYWKETKANKRKRKGGREERKKRKENRK